MGRLYRGTCKICREDFAARSPSALLSKMSKHRWKKHRAWMIRKIKEGKAFSEENPTIQDFIAALQEAPGRAMEIYETLRERDWMKLKRVLDAIEGLMSVEMLATWKAIEAFHDVRAK